MSKERLNLRAEHEAVAHLSKIERLNSEIITAAEKFLFLSVPDNESIHSAKLLWKTSSPLLVTVDECLGVGIGVELMTCVNKLLTKLLIVINFSVEKENKIFVLVVNRLSAAVKVDNGKTSESERNTVVYIVVCVIGTSVGNSVAHILDDFGMAHFSFGVNVTGKSAHIHLPLFFLLLSFVSSHAN